MFDGTGASDAKTTVVLRARWLPRLQNDEADQLTNMDFRLFDPKKRIRVSLERLGFQVLPELSGARSARGG